MNHVEDQRSVLMRIRNVMHNELLQKVAQIAEVYSSLQTKILVLTFPSEFGSRISNEY